MRCPKCSCEKIYSIRRDRLRCSRCRCEFSGTSATHLRYHKKPLGWYENIVKLRETGLNAHQISMQLGVDYKSVWIFLKVREAIDCHS